MRFLTFTTPGDYHSSAVKWALRRLFHEVDCFFITNIPQKGFLSLDLSNDIGADITISDGNICSKIRNYDVIWTRRFYNPVLPNSLHKSDSIIASSDWNSLIKYLQLGLAGSSIFQVNPPISVASRSLKALQLQYAIEVGLNIPRTYIGNDAAKIHRLMEESYNRETQIIVKPLTRAHWVDKDGVERGFMTSILTSSDLSEADLVSSPAIYQHLVQKAFEVRVVAMGATVLGFRLDSQSDVSSKIDYRKATNWGNLGNEPIEIPGEIHKKIIKFMKKSGILFSALDFAVDEQGVWTFFESNEMGNWLWIEAANPDVPLLDCFAKFLISRRADFLYVPPARSERLSISKFLSEHPDAAEQALVECRTNIDVPIAGRVLE